MIDIFARRLVFFWGSLHIMFRVSFSALISTGIICIFILFLFSNYIQKDYVDIFFKVSSFSLLAIILMCLGFTKYKDSVEYKLRQLQNIQKIDMMEIEALTKALVDRDERLKRREEWFRALIGASSEGMVAFDISGRINLVNPAATKLLGYEKYQELYGSPISSILSHKLVWYPVLNWFKDVPEHPVALTGRRYDGSEFPMILTVSKGGANGSTFMLAIIREIKNRKELC